jgi:hypothetical protein
MPCTRIRAETRWVIRGWRMSSRARVRRVAGSGRPWKVAENAAAPSRRSVTAVATRSGVRLNRSSYVPLTSKNGETWKSLPVAAAPASSGRRR